MKTHQEIRDAINAEESISNAAARILQALNDRFEERVNCDSVLALRINALEDVIRTLNDRIAQLEKSASWVAGRFEANEAQIYRLDKIVGKLL